VRESSPALDTRSARGVEFANGVLRSAEGSVRRAREICRVADIRVNGAIAYCHAEKARDLSEGVVSESRLVKKFR
jgi:hypothetical protein